MSYKTQSEVMKERWKDPEFREKIAKRVSQSNKARKKKELTEESRKKTSNTLKRRYAQMTEEQKAERSLRIKEGLAKSQKAKKVPEKAKKTKAEKTKEEKEKLAKTISQSLKKYNQSSEGLKKRKERAEKLKVYYKTEKGQKARQKISEIAIKTHRGRKHTKKHNEAKSEGISKAIIEGRMGGGYYKSSKRGHYTSPKAGDLYFRSAYELKAFLILDKDNTVLTYKHDSIRVPYSFEGQNRYYIIDLDIRYVSEDGEYLRKYVEVKPIAFLNDKYSKIKFEAAKKEFGDQFEVWTEKELQIDDYRKLLDELQPYLQ